MRAALTPIKESSFSSRWNRRNPQVVKMQLTADCGELKPNRCIHNTALNPRLKEHCAEEGRMIARTKRPGCLLHDSVVCM